MDPIDSKRSWPYIRILTYAVVIVAGGLFWSWAWERIQKEWRRDQNKAWRQYERAVDLLAESKYFEVEKALKEAIDLAEDEEAEFYRALGTHYFYTLKCEPALSNFRKAIRVNLAVEPRIIQSMTWCETELGHVERAIILLEKTRDKYPVLFTSRQEEFLRILQAKQKKPSSREKAPVTVVFQGQSFPAGLILAGNFLPNGEQDDTYGYAPIPFDRGKGPLPSIQLELKTDARFPYLFVVRNEKGEVLGSSELHLGSASKSSMIVSIPERAQLEKVFFKKKQVVRNRTPKGDGVRRVFIFWPDCGSWRIFRSLIERKLAPNSANLLAHSRYARMISEPPLTAIAIQRLTSFSPELSLWTTAKLQLKGLPMFDRFIDISPPKGETLGDRFQKMGVSFVDLTFNNLYVHSDSDVSEKLGEGSANYEFNMTKFEISKESVFREYVDLNRMQGLESSQNLYGKWLLASQWDDTQKKFNLAMSLFNSKERPQVLLLRIPASDILSHYFFTTQSGIAAGPLSLNLFYMYLDDLFGQVQAQLDQDDLFLLISDHGILNMFQHHPSSLFLVGDQTLKSPEILPPFPIEEFPSRLVQLVEARSGL